MAVLLALSLTLTTAWDLSPDGQAPPPTPVIEEVEVVEEAPLPTPREYLYQTYPSIARKLDCMIRLESTWVWAARAGPYLGLAQFDYGTWMETPQGKAGLSRTDPYASIDALAWGVNHLGYGRWPVTSRRC